MQSAADYYSSAYGHPESYTAMVNGEHSGSFSQDGSFYPHYQSNGVVDYSTMGGAAGGYHSYSSGYSSPTSPSYVNTASSVPVKRYTHDPYASASSNPSTPTLGSTPASNSAMASFNTSADSTTGGLPPRAAAPPHVPGYAPVYAPEGSYNDSVVYPVSNSTVQQFNDIVGNVASTACTARGRQLLVTTMRLQHADKIQIIFDECLPSIHELCLHPHGCHVVRTLVECLSESQITTMVQHFTPELIIELATNSQYTRRILQTMFERHKSDSFDYIVSTIADTCASVSCTQQGCIAVMRILENALPGQQRLLLEALSPNLGNLVLDAYGNYVVQSIIQTADPVVACNIIVPSFQGHWVQLACNKFASNVLEKLLRIATPETRTSIFSALVYNQSGLETILGDGFGNFVLQACIETSYNSSEFTRVADLVRPMLPKSPFGHKIEAKLKQKRIYL